MRPLYRNLFLLFGLAAIAFMFYKFDLSWTHVQRAVLGAGYYLPAMIAVWVFVYACNAAAFQIIVNTTSSAQLLYQGGTVEQPDRLGFWRAYKLTVSGFAFSYTTPFGFGGLPYRIMELTNYVGKNRAISSTVLYSTMHILSHFCLWTLAAFLLMITYTEKINLWVGTLLAIYFLVLALAIYFFFAGYRNGMVLSVFSFLQKIPVLKSPSTRLYEAKRESLEQMDANISYLHSRPKAFYSSLAFDALGRLINAFEFYFILLAIHVDITFVDAILVLAFSSLMGNLLFFLPMQLGAREGGLAMSLAILGKGVADGFMTGIFTRIRELFWICVGVALVKIGNKSFSDSSLSLQEERVGESLVE